MAAIDKAEWQAWMRSLGLQVRRVREFVGLSQEQVARTAGVSQGAVSRLEAGRGLGTPLLVTTVDHALLQPEWVRQFIDATPADADIAVLLAPEAVVHAAAPTTQRTYLKFRDGRYSACNLFLLRTPRALAAVDLWCDDRFSSRSGPVALISV